METIAVYWEEKIRTYGINLLEGLVLVRASLPVARMGRWGGVLQSTDASASAFRLVWAQSESPEQTCIYFLCDEIHCQKMLSGLASSSGLETPCEKMAVDLIYLQGPHFGDRYGIMEFTLQALAPKKVPILATVCAMATVYLVLPAGWGRTACDILTLAFEIPKTTTGREK